MPEKKIIAVIGATGTQGGSVVRTFLKKPDWKVRGITRDVSKPSAQQLTAQGVEVVAGDMSDIESLKRAFAGATAIFVMTEPSMQPGTENGDSEPGRPANLIAHEIEVQLIKNSLHAASSPEVLPGLQRFVFSSLPSVKEISGGRYTNALHFESKALPARYIQTDLPELAKKTSFIQVGVYLENWKRIPFWAPQKQSDSTVLFSWPMDPKKNVKLPWVHAANDVGPCVSALVEKAPAGTTVLATNQEITSEEYAEIFGRIKQVSARFEPMPLDVLQRMLETVSPPSMAQQYVETFSYSMDYGYDGGLPNTKRPIDIGVDPSELSTVEQYIRQTDFGLS